MDIETAAAAALCLISIANYISVYRNVSRRIRRPRQRKLWMTAIHRSRTGNSFYNFLKDLEESGEFHKFFRMSKVDFYFILNRIEPLIKKKDTHFRKAIPPTVRFALTLRYLVTGDSFKSLHYFFKVSPQQISLIIPEVCHAINTILKDEIKIPTMLEEWIAKENSFKREGDPLTPLLPQTPEDWVNIEKGFRRRFPKCIGAIDGKHIVVKCPTHSGSEYYNYKNTYSVVLMAVVDSDYKFIFADIGGQGRISDGGIFKNCLLWQKLNTGTLNLPADSPLPGRNVNVPYVFLSDGAFAIHNHIMKPFAGDHNIGTKERIFNYRLSSTRVIVENVFGILTAAFRIFRKPIEIQIEKVPIITKTCILLHNFLRRSTTSRNIYSKAANSHPIDNESHIDDFGRQNNTENLEMRELRQIPRPLANDVITIRNEFANYFYNLNV